MTTTSRSQKTYDHGLKQLVSSTGSLRVALDHGVPRSTARGWLRSPRREVVTVPHFDIGTDELHRSLSAARAEPESRSAAASLGRSDESPWYQADESTPSGGQQKRAALNAVAASRNALLMRAVLRVLGEVFRRVDITCGHSHEKRSVAWMTSNRVPAHLVIN